MNIDDAIVTSDILKKVGENRKYNELITSYYDMWAGEGGAVAFPSSTLRRKSKRVSECNKTWYTNYYQKSHIKDFQKTILCRDKFCSNCKKIRQASRMAKYIPEIEKYKDHLFHMTLTVPNCKGVDLRNTIKHMSDAYKRFTKIVSGKRDIGLYMDGYCYLGAIRSLEVTFRNDSYHPHYHVAIVFDNLTIDYSDCKEVNDFSYSYGKLTTLFHPFEILIQKIWYLCYNNKPVTLSAINKLDIGYSCTVKKFKESDYAELFKYMTKETNEDGLPLSYTNFINLSYGTQCKKQIQGYGCFYRIINDDGDLDLFDQLYEDMIKELNSIERPISCYDTVDDLLRDKNVLISRKSYFKYLRLSLLDEGGMIIEEE